MAYTPPSALSGLIYPPEQRPTSIATSIDMLRVITQGPDKANSVYLENQGDDIISNLVCDGHNPMLRGPGNVLAPPCVEILYALAFKHFKLFLMISQISHIRQNQWLI